MSPQEGSNGSPKGAPDGRVPISRREFLKLAGLAGASMVFAAGLGDLLASCHDSPTTTIATPRTATTAATANSATDSTSSTTSTSVVATSTTTTILPRGAVATDAGPISGEVVPSGGKTLYCYRGIPYAAPPIGDLRFKPPVPVTPWTQVRVCTQFTPIAPQPSLADSPFFPGGMGAPSEDCLYLSVATPTTDAAARLPVMFFLHGGGYSVGGADSRPSLDPSLAGRGVVLVGANHRLGVMGLLALPQLSVESASRASGNYEFLDLVAALEWVQKNISNFGGDPGNVTIFGESGGSGKAFLLTASPLAKGLLHKAICQSGPPWTFLPEISLQEAHGRGMALMGELGLDLKSPNVLRDLRALSWETIVNGNASLGDKGLPTLDNHPVVDGYFLPDTVRRIFQAGSQSAIPLIGGDCRGEVTGPGAVFMPSAPGAYADAFDLMAKKGVKSYCYVFSHVPSKWKSEGCVAFHSIEMSYLFGDLTAVGLYYPDLARPAGAAQSDPGLQAIDQKVSQRLQNMWTNFAKSGNPSVAGVVNWPAYTKAGDRYLDIGDSLRVRAGFSRIKPPRPTLVRFEQTDPHLVYTGTWHTFFASGASGGSYKRANIAGASVTVKFSGTYFAWIATVGTTLGNAWVSLDGGPARNIDLARAAVAYQQKVWSTGTLSSRIHTVKIWWDGGNAVGKYISIDAVDVVGTLI